MSPIFGRLGAFLAQTRKDRSVALFPGCSRGYELRGLDDAGGKSDSAPDFSLTGGVVTGNGTRKGKPSWSSEGLLRHANRALNMIMRNDVSGVWCGSGGILLGIHNDMGRLLPVTAWKPSCFTLQMS